MVIFGCCSHEYRRGPSIMAITNSASRYASSRMKRTKWAGWLALDTTAFYFGHTGDELYPCENDTFLLTMTRIRILHKLRCKSAAYA